MAKQKGYQPYKTRQNASRTSRIVILTLLIVITGIVVLIKSRKDKPAATEPEIATESYREVLPDAPASNGGATQAVRREVPPPSTVTIPDRQPGRTTAAAAPATAPEPAPAAPVEPAVQTDAAAPAAEAVEPAVVTTTAPAPDPDIDAEATTLINQAVAERQAGKVIAARNLLNDALQMKLTPAVRQEVKVQLTKLSEQWLFSEKVLAGDTLTGLYKVMPGDYLSRIGPQHQVPHEILMTINGIHNAKSLQAGQTIKVINGPFHAVVDLSTYTLDLYLQTMYVKSYKVGIGKVEHQTPTGLWRVEPGGKLVQPPWTDPDTGRNYKASDPDYPLGSRWIALEGLDGNARGRTGFALHGTKDPETIGTRSSRGCIRLFNGEVIELYNMLEAGKSLVKVVE